MAHLRFELPGEPLTEYRSSGVRSVGVAHGRGEAHVWLLSFDPGGVIGPHTAGFDQLFLVLEGDAWMSVAGVRTDLAAHEAATVGLGEVHEKGSDSGGRVLMVQLSSLDDPLG